MEKKKMYWDQINISPVILDLSIKLQSYPSVLLAVQLHLLDATAENMGRFWPIYFKLAALRAPRHWSGGPHCPPQPPSAANAPCVRVLQACWPVRHSPWAALDRHRAPALPSDRQCIRRFII